MKKQRSLFSYPSLILPTSFPGFSPTRPLSLRRAGWREPWERGCNVTWTRRMLLRIPPSHRFRGWSDDIRKSFGSVPFWDANTTLKFLYQVAPDVSRSVEWRFHKPPMECFRLNLSSFNLHGFRVPFRPSSWIHSTIIEFGFCIHVKNSVNQENKHGQTDNVKPPTTNLGLPFAVRWPKHDLRKELFHLVVVQWRQRNVRRSVLHLQSCCFANSRLLFDALVIVVIS